MKAPGSVNLLKIYKIDFLTYLIFIWRQIYNIIVIIYSGWPPMKSYIKSIILGFSIV